MIIYRTYSVNTMVKKTTKTTSDQDVSEDLPNWTTENVAEFATGTIKIRDDKVLHRKMVDEQINGKATGDKVEVVNVYVEIGGKEKQTKFNKKSIAACAKVFGRNAMDWAGKKVTAIHETFNSRSYIVWKPAGSLPTK